MAAFETNMKILKIDEKVIRSQPVFHGQKLAQVLKLAFYGRQEYAENIIRCISMFSLLVWVFEG